MATRKSSTGPKLPRVAVVAGLRTPFARQLTHYREVSTLNLGKGVVAELLSRLSLPPTEVERVVFGQVLPSLEAPNIAREIVLATGMDRRTDAYSVSRACATSFQAVADIAAAIQLGDISVGVAGGADSASVVPISVSRKLAATLVQLQKAGTLPDRLSLLVSLRPADLVPVPPAPTEFSTGLTMGEHAEQMAKDHHISREDQDLFAHRSHTRAARAWSEGLLRDEVMTTWFPPGHQPVDQDNNIRGDTSLEDYAKLKPAFDRRHGTLTAANSSALTDGAAAVVLMSEVKVKELGLTPLGWLKSWAFAALDPRKDMLMGPAYATPRALDRAGITLKDLTLIDIHEAFAAQVLCNLQAFNSTKFAREQLGRAQALGEIDPEHLNVLGGSIAFGHPFAATGARMITQTLRELGRRGGGLALTTACAAGGLGAAFVWEV